MSLPATGQEVRKHCCGCKLDIPLKDFYRNASQPSGYAGYCKACSKARVLEYRRANPEKRKTHARNYYLRHKEQCRQSSKRWEAAHPETVRAWRKQHHHIRHAKQIAERFGLTQEQYAEMLSAQSGVCAICHKKDRRRLSVDHDHKTGAVRGLLCGRCNMAIGLFSDDAELLYAAVNYLCGEQE